MGYNAYIRESVLKEMGEDQLSLILENVMLDNCRNYDKGSYFNSRFRDRVRESAVVSNRNIIAIVRLSPNIYTDGFFV